MKPIRIVLADDHDLVRAGIRSLLHNIENVEVGGEAGNGEEVLRLIGALRPDTVLMDIMMPGLNGLEAARRIKQQSVPPLVVIVTLHEENWFRAAARRAGADGLLNPA